MLLREGANSARQRTSLATIDLGVTDEVIPPYYELPDDLRDWLVFMELTL